MRYYPHPIGFFIYILSESPETREDIFPVNPATCKNSKNFYNFQKSQPAVIYIVEGHEKARGFERKHSIYFQDGHRKCRNGIPEFKKGTAFLPSTFSGKVTNSANTEKLQRNSGLQKISTGQK